jgi:site-specific recombinase XerD
MSSASKGQWIARFYDSGQAKQHFHPLGDFGATMEAERYGEALKSAMKWFSHLDRGGSASSLSMHEIADRYVDHVRRTRGETAAKDVRRRLDTYVLTYTPFDSLDVTKLTATHLDRWRRWLTDRPSRSGPNRGGQRTDATQNRDLTCLRSALNLALADGLLTTDAPWKKRLAPIKGADRRRGVFLTSSDLDRLIEATSPEFRDFFSLLRLVPLRPGAAAALKVKDLNPQLQSIRIGKDKANGDRWIPLPRETYEAVASFARGKLPAAPLVGSPTGKHWTRHHWKVPFSRAAAIAALPEDAVTYSIRHSGISSLLHDGVDPLTVSYLAGTSLRVIAAFYAHASDDRVRSALGHLAKVKTRSTN